MERRRATLLAATDMAVRGAADHVEQLLEGLREPGLESSDPTN